jgi:hypothetical protein
MSTLRRDLHQTTQVASAMPTAMSGEATAARAGRPGKRGRQLSRSYIDPFENLLQFAHNVACKYDVAVDSTTVD